MKKFQLHIEKSILALSWCLVLTILLDAINIYNITGTYLDSYIELDALCFNEEYDNSDTQSNINSFDRVLFNSKNHKINNLNSKIKINYKRFFSDLDSPSTFSEKYKFKKEFITEVNEDHPTFQNVIYLQYLYLKNCSLLI